MQPANANTTERTLYIASSGGGGHNSAIEALISRDQDNAKMLHVPCKRKKQSGLAITQGSSLMHMFPSMVQEFVCDKSNIPQLPTASVLKTEVSRLLARQTGENDIPKARFYVDHLLDVLPDGYACAALWNVLQREDRTPEIRKLINYQPRVEKKTYALVKDFYLQRLQAQVETGTPITKVVCTQALNLNAIADAVLEYNKWFADKKSAQLKQLRARAQEQSRAIQNFRGQGFELEQARQQLTQIEARIIALRTSAPVYIDLYVTDVLTDGAVHFLGSFKRLSPEQKSVINCHAVNLSALLQRDAQLKQNFSDFHAQIDIDPHANPLLRAAFRQAACESANITTVTQQNKTVQHDIATTSRVATVMLGSQAGPASLSYAAQFGELGFDKVFVCGGDKFAEQVAKLQQQYPQCEIIALPHQPDTAIKQLFERSDALVIRGGGLSTMERLARRSQKPQQVFFHTPHNYHGTKSTGILWEDGNIAYSKDHIEAGSVCSNTDPNQFIFDFLISQARMKYDEKRAAAKVSAIRKLGSAENFNSQLISLLINMSPEYAKRFKICVSADLLGYLSLQDGYRFQTLTNTNPLSLPNDVNKVLLLLLELHQQKDTITEAYSSDVVDSLNEALLYHCHRYFSAAEIHTAIDSFKNQLRDDLQTILINYHCDHFNELKYAQNQYWREHSNPQGSDGIAAKQTLIHFENLIHAQPWHLGFLGGLRYLLIGKRSQALPRTLTKVSKRIAKAAQQEQKNNDALVQLQAKMHRVEFQVEEYKKLALQDDYTEQASAKLKQAQEQLGQLRKQQHSLIKKKSSQPYWQDALKDVSAILQKSQKKSSRFSFRHQLTQLFYNKWAAKLSKQVEPPTSIEPNISRIVP